jgi:PAS domain S-box-containing protein
VIDLFFFELPFRIAHPFVTKPLEGTNIPLSLPHTLELLFLLFLLILFFGVLHQRKILRDKEDRFRSLADTVPVMLWMSGPDGRCTFFNKSWLEFSGLTLTQESEQDWVGRVHPEDRKRCINEYLFAFKLRETFNLQYRLLRHDGIYRWVNHNGTPWHASDGTFLGYIGSRVDFTDYREVEEEFRKMTTHLIHEHEIERYRIGHELHEDLAQKLCALSFGLSHFSRNCEGTSSVAAGIDELQAQLRAVYKDVVRLSRQLRPMTVEGVGLSAALRNLCDRLNDDQRVVQFTEDENLPRLPDDISLGLYRIAEECLKNAFAHSGATHMCVELSATETALRLSVRDNGCGFVTDSKPKPALGLSRISEHARSLGGAFRIVSAPGEGTVAIATTPLPQTKKGASMPPACSVEAPVGSLQESGNAFRHKSRFKLLD